MKTDYPLWTKLPYAGEKEPPKNPEELFAGSWKLFYVRRSKNRFVTPLGKKIKLNVKNPNTIDWKQQLTTVQQTLKNITSQQIQIARYWAEGPPTKQWTPIIDRLIDTYGVTVPRAGRILAAVQAGINDTLILTWHVKYKTLVARPNQFDQQLATIVCTPRHPSYVSGHAAAAGAAAILLSYFFPGESKRIIELAKEAALSRLYAGVHFPVDNEEGLKLGKQIGQIAVFQLKNQRNSQNKPIDVPYTENRNARLMPPPYRQAIPYHDQHKCESLVLRI